MKSVGCGRVDGFEKEIIRHSPRVSRTSGACRRMKSRRKVTERHHDPRPAAFSPSLSSGHPVLALPGPTVPGRRHPQAPEATPGSTAPPMLTVTFHCALPTGREATPHFPTKSGWQTPPPGENGSSLCRTYRAGRQFIGYVSVCL